MTEAQVKVRFFTQEEDASLHANEAPLFVPVSLRRYGLSEVVNHLLAREEPVPFDFLIDGVLLRLSLDDYLTKSGLSAETFLQIEYTRAVLPPLFLASFSNEDWVLSVDTIHSGSAGVRGEEVAPQILAGGYDGVVRTYDMSGAVTKQYVGHLAAVKAVKWIYAHRIVSAGNDHQVRLWKTAHAGKDDDGEAEGEVEGARTVAILAGHRAPVVALDVLHALRRILSGGSDHAVCLWSTVPKDMKTVEPYGGDASGALLATKKRRRLAARDTGVPHRAPLLVLEGHSAPVEGVAFDHDSSVAYSVAQDHTVKTWDLVTARCVDTRTTGFPLLSVLPLPGASLIACGLSARHINLHDPRTHAGATERTARKLAGHTNFVVDLAACPTNSNMFASASHDGVVKVWDVRADTALYTIARETGKSKVLGVAWDEVIGIVSGGEDKKVQINKGNDIAR